MYVAVLWCAAVVRACRRFCAPCGAPGWCRLWAGLVHAVGLARAKGRANNSRSPPRVGDSPLPPSPHDSRYAFCVSFWLALGVGLRTLL